VLDISSTQVMGILNVTPDSFSDGGSLYSNQRIDLEQLLCKAQAMVDSGATILDIGGESTRPNAEPVSEQQEMDRVLPALEMLVSNLDVVVSIDTSNASLMREAAMRGAGMLNDVRALERPGAMQAAADSGLPVCLMHMQGTPQTMQNAPSYDDVTSEVLGYLHARARLCEQQGIAKQNVLFDPGFGFGKTLQQNLQLLRDTHKFVESGYPVLIGTSRKSMFGQLLGRSVENRLAAGLASTAFAAINGAAIVRVHDVEEAVDVVSVIKALNNG
jgi:dihydropteroate synthase